MSQFENKAFAAGGNSAVCIPNHDSDTSCVVHDDILRVVSASVIDRSRAKRRLAISEAASRSFFIAEQNRIKTRITRQANRYQ